MPYGSPMTMTRAVRQLSRVAAKSLGVASLTSRTRRVSNQTRNPTLCGYLLRMWAHDAKYVVASVTYIDIAVTVNIALLRIMAVAAQITPGGDPGLDRGATRWVKR